MIEAAPELDRMTSCVPVAKCPVPIIWVDTSVLLKLAKLKLSKNLNKHDIESTLLIQGRIQSLVQQGKLICPEGEQQSEYLRTDSLFTRVFDDISHGVKAKPTCMVEFDNIIRTMESYVLESSVQHSYLHAFPANPVPAEFLDPFQQYRVRLVETWSQKHIDELSQSRDAIHTGLESLRNQNSIATITFQEQLNLELYSASTLRFREAWIFANKMIHGIEPTFNEFSFWNEADMLRSEWRKLVEKHKHNRDEADFFHSSEYHSVPSIDISARLYAALLTGSRKIQNGDSMDIRHISSFLPYADMMIIDKSMKHLVTTLKLDEKYGTTVVYAGDTDVLNTFFDYCEGLESRRKNWWEAQLAI